MPTRLKTSITLDTSAITQGEEIDALDFLPAYEDARDYLREGNITVTDADTHVKSLETAIVPVAPLAAKAVDGSGVGKQLQLYMNGTLAPANGGAGANTSSMSGIPKLTAGVVSVATAETDYVTPTGTGTLQNKTLNNTNNVSLAALDKTNTAGAGVGDVPTWDGSQYSPAPPGGGGAEPVDITVTAGENLALRDYVYLSSDNKWYKVDSDDTTPKVGRVRGFVIELAGIAADASGEVRLIGEVTGFTGLTAWADVFASTTAGGITQTKPTVTAGGGQKAVLQIGYATSTTKVMVLPHYPVEFLKRESLADDAYLTITHPTDPQGRGRLTAAHISSTDAGLTIATYASGNQDTNVQLRGASGTGGTTTPDSAGTTPSVLGDTGGSEYRLAQSFQVTAGILSQITVHFDANAGSPTGLLTWEIRTDNASKPSATVLQSGTHTITPSSNNTITVSGGIFLSASTTYWLVLSVPAQSTGNYYAVYRNTSGAYGDGVMWWDINSANAWDGLGGTNEMRCSITTSALVVKDKLAQSFQVTGSQIVDSVKLWLKKTGSPADMLTLRIETDNSGSPSGTLVDAAATVTVAESSLGTSYGWVTFNFASNFTLNDATPYWLVLSTGRSASNTNYVEWGADASSPSYASGEMKYEASSTWSAETKDACFDVIAVGVTYDEPCSIGRWNASSGVDVGVQYADGSGADGNITTSFKNIMGTTEDITCSVKIF